DPGFPIDPVFPTDPGPGPGGPEVIEGEVQILNVGGAAMMVLRNGLPVQIKLGASIDEEAATGVRMDGVPAGMRFNATTMVLSGSPRTRAVTRMTATYSFASGRVFTTDYFMNITNDPRSQEIRFATMNPMELRAITG
ncbi:MAG: hypothetical protein Q4G64_07215, partial [bacterium]|nr:hypothetical protein [bacterium]